VSKKTRRPIKQSARADLRAVAAADEELSHRDAERLADLAPDDPARLLHLVAQLPALTPEVLAYLTHDHVRGDLDGGERMLAGLEERGLVRQLHVVGPDGSIPYCVILTPRGTTVLARTLGTDAGTLSARYGLDYPSLGVRIGWAPETLRRYEMLALLAGCAPSPPLLLGWRRYWPPGSERALDAVDPLRWALPACVRIRMDGRDAEYLLLADEPEDPIATIRSRRPVSRPVGFYEPVVRRVLAHHATMDREPPRLLVAAETEERMLAWGAMFKALDEVLPNARLGLTVATWDGFPTALAAVLVRDLYGARVVFQREDT
jgi:hypothetical protein